MMGLSQRIAMIIVLVVTELAVFLLQALLRRPNVAQAVGAEQTTAPKSLSHCIRRTVRHQGRMLL